MSRPHDLILVGIQGSGKGTQAKILAKKYGYQIFETGGALRSIAQEDTPLGQMVKEITTRGDLVPNETVMEIVQNFIHTKADAGKPIIFDGIPRSEIQRESLEKLLKELKREFLVIHIELGEEEAFKRLTKRAIDQGRSDDNPESIRKRIKNFRDYTEPLLEIWRKQNKVLCVNGENSVEAVTESIEALLRARL